MAEHLRIREGRVQTLTTSGETAEELLGLNDAATVEFREKILRQIKNAKGRRAEAEDSKRQIQRALAGGRLSSEARDEYLDDLAHAESAIAEANAVLRDLVAEG